MYSGIIFSVSVLIVLALFFVFRKKTSETFNKFAKVLVVVYCAIGFFRFFLSDSFIYVINGANFNGKYYDTTDVLQTILRWGYYMGYVVVPMAVFFDSRLWKNLMSYVFLPFAILSAVFVNDYMVYFLDPIGHGLHFATWFRYLFFILELVLAIVIPVIVQIKHKHVFNFKDKIEWRNFLLALPCVIIVMMPVYVPQSLIGYSKLLAEIGSPFHIAWIAVSVILTLFLYYMFRFSSYRIRYMLIVFLTLALFYNYDSCFLMGFTLSRLPIQLCNLASYIYMIAIIFKREKFFQFAFLANITGAIIAFIASDFSGGAFKFWNVHFVYEHTLVLMIPALAMGLRVFPRITRKALAYSAIGFTIYFIFCVTAGVLINGFVENTTESKLLVNYFFMFDLDKALKYVPFISIIKYTKFVIGNFTFYPLLAVIIYFAFSILYILFYKLTKVLYVFEDDRLELRRSAIDLYEKRTKKVCRIRRDFQD